MAQHGLSLPAGAVNLITERVGGWAAGLRLAALSLDGHPDPGLFIKNLAAEDNALTSYPVDEVLDAQPPAQRELMLRTSILDRVSADVAWELTGDEQAGGTLAALARSGGFIQPLGHGWYRYHPLLAEVLRLKLRLESPDRTPGLHRQAASWYQRNGRLERAVAHAAAINDWQLATRIVVDELAIGELLKPRGSSPVADALRRIPVPGVRSAARRSHRPCWRPPPLSYVTAVTKKAGRLLAAAGECLDRLPAGHDSLPGWPPRRSGSPRRAGAGILTQPGRLPPRRRPCSSSFRLACGTATRRLRGTYCLAAVPSSSGPAIRAQRPWPSPVRQLPSRKTAASGRPVTGTSP